MSDKCCEVLISGLDMATAYSSLQHLCLPAEDPQEVQTLQNSALVGKRSMDITMIGGAIGSDSYRGRESCSPLETWHGRWLVPQWMTAHPAHVY